MNMLSSLKALLFSTAAPGVAAVQPASPGETADFAALFNGTMAEETAVAPALPQIEGPALPPVAADIPPIEQRDTATAPSGLLINMAPPEATPAQGHVPHGLAIAVAAGKSLPSQLPPGRALGFVKQAADVPVEQQPQVEPSPSQAQSETSLPDEAPIPEPDASGEAPVQPEAAVPDKGTKPAQSPKAHPAAHKDEPEPGPAIPVMAEASPVETQSSPKQKAKVERTEQDPAATAPVPQPVMAAEAVPPVNPEPVADASTDGSEPVAAAPNVAPIMTVPVPSAPSRGPAPIQSDPERIAPDQRHARGEGKISSAVPDAPVAVMAGESPAPEGVSPAAPVLNGKPVKAEAIALLAIVREQVAARQTGAPIRVGEQVSAAAHAKAETPARSAEPALDSSVVPPSPDAAPAAPPVAAPQTASLSPPSAVPASPSPDLSASLGAQVVDMGVSGQWIDGLARDIAGLSANGAQGRFQIDTQHLGAVQVDIRHDTDGAAVSLTVASEAAEAALRQDSDRLKLDAGLAAVRIAELKVERAPAVAEAHRAETGGQSSSQQQQQQSQQGSQSSAWAQNNGQNMGQPQGQQNRWQGRENNGFGPKGSGDPAVLNHADAQPAAHGRARARYA
ncbi:flagellar hook-length control protein FliK [Novosphingobium sp. Chol11]|uniref:flagellar hook-length control protein FliK n=1 Tax=Novosphingobium sp. Chol11 TaxID=1385763 RepID=UPI0020D21D95|nr:flagellar hook-length control protein FliK [Novosphingobium sp. Chol11]